MKVVAISALFALAFGLAGVNGATAASFGGNGVNNATQNMSLIEEAQYRRCRSVRVCRVGPFGRRCHWERVCRGHRW